MKKITRAEADLITQAQRLAEEHNRLVREEMERTGDEEAVVVCAVEGTWTPFDDNLTGVCTRCGRGVIFRPTAPRYPKICAPCALKTMAAEAEGQLPRH